jgi:hypothetical protein
VMSEAKSKNFFCDAAIRPFPNNTELNCEVEGSHRDHQAMLADYAFPGSRQLITWHEDDRRNFHGDWPGRCPYKAHPLWDDPGQCTLPDGHPGNHAP